VLGCRRSKLDVVEGHRGVDERLQAVVVVGVPQGDDEKLHAVVVAVVQKAVVHKAVVQLQRRAQPSQANKSPTRNGSSLRRSGGATYSTMGTFAQLKLGSIHHGASARVVKEIALLVNLSAVQH